MTRYSLAVLMLLPCVECAQEKKQEERPRPENMVTRMIRLEHADPLQVRNLLAGTGARVQWDKVLRVVVVSGSPSEVESVEQTVKQVDAEMAKVTISNAEVTVYIMGASEDSLGNTKPPASLEKTVEQIKASFPYQSFRLLETAVVRCRMGEGTQVSGSLQPFHSNEPNQTSATKYSLRFRLGGADSMGGREAFHVQEFEFFAQFPYTIGAPNAAQHLNSDARIQTTFDVASNQQVVIGKAGVAGNNAVFLIVEAKAVK